MPLLLGRGHASCPDDPYLSRQHCLLAYNQPTGTASVTWMGRRCGRLCSRRASLGSGRGATNLQTSLLHQGAQRQLGDGDMVILLGETGRYPVVIALGDGDEENSRPSGREWVVIEATARAAAEWAVRGELAGRVAEEQRAAAQKAAQKAKLAAADAELVDWQRSSAPAPPAPAGEAAEDQHGSLAAAALGGEEEAKAGAAAEATRQSRTARRGQFADLARTAPGARADGDRARAADAEAEEYDEMARVAPIPRDSDWVAPLAAAPWWARDGGGAAAPAAAAAATAAGGPAGGPVGGAAAASAWLRERLARRLGGAAAADAASPAGGPKDWRSNDAEARVQTITLVADPQPPSRAPAEPGRGDFWFGLGITLDERNVVVAVNPESRAEGEVLPGDLITKASCRTPPPPPPPPPPPSHSVSPLAGPEPLSISPRFPALRLTASRCAASRCRPSSCASSCRSRTPSRSSTAARSSATCSTSST